jgi:hypothetical protein
VNHNQGKDFIMKIYVVVLQEAEEWSSAVVAAFDTREAAVEEANARRMPYGLYEIEEVELQLAK